MYESVTADRPHVMSSKRVESAEIRACIVSIVGSRQCHLVPALGPTHPPGLSGQGRTYCVRGACAVRSHVAPVSCPGGDRVMSAPRAAAGHDTQRVTHGRMAYGYSPL